MVCIDPAEFVITSAVTALKALYDPDSPCPPEGGGTKDIKVVSGEGPMWDPILQMNENDGECGDPFVWVRLVMRARTTNFPEPDLGVNCLGDPLIVVEFGVGRCSPDSLQPVPDYREIAKEAEIGRDDSWRLDKLVCAMRGTLKDGYMVAAEPILPQGPEGGGIVWSTTLYVAIITD